MDIRRHDMFPLVESRLKQSFFQRQGWEIYALWHQEDTPKYMPPYLLVNKSSAKIKKVPVEVRALKRLRRADIDRMVEYIERFEEGGRVEVPFALLFIPSTCEIPKEIKNKYPVVFNKDDLELAMRMGQKPVLIRKISPKTIARNKRK